MNKIECAFRTKDYGCKKLTVTYCMGAACPFAQTTVKTRVSFKKASVILVSLGKDEQQYIADKYFFGKMPWQKGGASNDR
ncbi:MAG: hypothetical protein WCQ41_06325 [Bacillota bacterium]